MIDFVGVSKQYRRHFYERPKTVLAEVTFSVPRGSIFGFLGANGAGKTTSIKILLGLQFADKGEARIAVDRSKVGFMPERPYVYEDLTAKEYLNFHRRLFPRGEGPTNEELLRTVGLKGIEGTPMRNFSKGMQQRLCIAQSLIHDPELLILDEPTSGLDPRGRRDVMQLLSELHSKGKTLFFSTHILSDAEKICSHLAILENSRIKFSGEKKDLFEKFHFQSLEDALFSQSV